MVKQTTLANKSEGKSQTRKNYIKKRMRSFTGNLITDNVRLGTHTKEQYFVPSCRLLRCQWKPVVARSGSGSKLRWGFPLAVWRGCHGSGISRLPYWGPGFDVICLKISPKDKQNINKSLYSNPPRWLHWQRWSLLSWLLKQAFLKASSISYQDQVITLLLHYLHFLLVQFMTFKISKKTCLFWIF